MVYIPINNGNFGDEDNLVSLAPKAATLAEPRLSSGRHAQNGVAAGANNDGLRVAEHSRDREAALAFHVHEV
jgi:hypothetical protein